MRLLLLLAASVFVGLCPAIEACQICIPFPKKSAADYLIEADVVVLAREDPERAFHFRAVAVLKGDPGAEKIDLFLDSSSRRTLAVFPRQSVVLVRNSDEGKADWRRIGMADAEFGPLVHEILRSAPSWAGSPNLRVEFFGKLLGHENAQINSLAHLEIARAPYSEIKAQKDVLSRDKIHVFLKNFRYMEWHALYILLLAQSEDARDREFISDSFRSVARFGTSTRLAAWATAFIELEGEKAIDYIESEYFRKNERSPAELREVMMALSVHGTCGHTYLRDRIVASYEILLSKFPSMTPDVAKDLIAWKRTELADEVASYVAAHQFRLDLPTTLELMAYGRKAKSENRTAEIGRE